MLPRYACGCQILSRLNQFLRIVSASSDCQYLPVLRHGIHRFWEVKNRWIIPVPYALSGCHLELNESMIWFERPSLQPGFWHTAAFPAAVRFVSFHVSPQSCVWYHLDIAGAAAFIMGGSEALHSAIRYAACQMGPLPPAPPEPHGGWNNALGQHRAHQYCRGQIHSSSRRSGICSYESQDLRYAVLTLKGLCRDDGMVSFEVKHRRWEYL